MMPKLVEVTWLDACLRTSGCPLSKVADEARLSLRTTVGYLVLKTRDRIVVAMTYDKAEKSEDEDHVDDLYTIPRGWVKSIKERR